MSIGNFSQDDLYQITAIFFCIMSLGFWVYVMRHSSSPFYFAPPIIASIVTLVFYLVVIFVPMSTERATTLSAARSLADMIMWTISGASMAYILRRDRMRDL